MTTSPVCASVLRLLRRAERFREDKGSSLIETALVMPLLAFLLVVAIDCGRAYFYTIAVQSAAQAGALYGLLAPADVAGMVLVSTSNAGNVPTLATTASYGCECGDGSNASPTCTSLPVCTANVVNYVQVDTRATYKPLLAYPGIPSNYVLTGHARLRVAP